MNYCTITLQGTFEQFNYLRSPINFEKLWNNINLQLFNKEQKILFILPVSILSIGSLQTSINLIYGLRSIYCDNTQLVDFKFDILDVPEYLNIKLLPLKFIDMLEYTWSFMLKKMAQSDNPITGFSPNELKELEQIIEYMQDRTELDSEYCLKQQIKFFSTIQEYDLSHNKNFCSIFPDMIDYYQLCKRVYNES